MFIPDPVPEIIDPVFAKTSPKRSFSITKYERFGLLFTKTRVYKFGHWIRMFSIPDTGSDFFPSWIPDPHQIFRYFNPNNWFLRSRKDDPGCSSRILPGSRIQGSKRHRIPDPDPQLCSPLSKKSTHKGGLTVLRRRSASVDP
jgi:hypothetical protein